MSTQLDLLTSYLDVSTVLVILSCLLVSFIYLEWKRAGRLPPGPTGIPFLGYGPFIDDSVSFWITSRELAKRYKSDITSLNLFGTTAVFLTSREAVKKAFQKRQDMAERPKDLFFKAFDPMFNGIVASSGELWKEHRRFSLTMLREFGMGKIAAENSIQNEAENLCQHFKDLGKKTATDPLKVLEPALSNIICAIALGKRFSYDDPKFLAALDAMNFFETPAMTAYFSAMVSKNIKWIAPLLYFNVKRTAMKHYAVVRKFICDIIDEHKEKFDESFNDLIDGFLIEQSKRTDANHSFTHENLLYIIFDLFSAGTETITSTLRWTLLYLIKYPLIQQRIFDEIMSVIGSERVPNMSDKISTPYTEAFLLEIQRFHTIAPMSVVHSCSEDIQFMGYTIPANSAIFSNLALLHRDPSVFEDPDTFLPERFLDGDKKVINADKLTQFGIGKRVCVGESLARMEIYIFFTTLVQRLQFVPYKNLDIEIVCDAFSSIHAPTAFLLYAIPR